MDTSHVIALGVLAQLAFSLAHHFVKAPKQQAQLDQIEATVTGLLGTVTGAAALSAGKDAAK